MQTSLALGLALFIPSLLTVLSDSPALKSMCEASPTFQPLLGKLMPWQPMHNSTAKHIIYKAT